jgi:dipeptidyl aminopeptidase/acylaminoacyl peptidase
LTRRAEQRFTTDASFNAAPIWSPNNDRIVFSSSRGGGIYNLYQKATSGSGKDEVLLVNGNAKAPTQWSRDGRSIVYFERDPRTKLDIWVLPMDRVTERKPVPFLRSEFNELLGQHNFTASSRTFEAFLGLGCFRPDAAFLRAALDFRATLPRAAQIRVTATSRDSNFLSGFTPGSPL